MNEEWLGDKSRFALDGLRRRRLDRPWVRRDGKLVEASWPEAFAAIAEKLHGVAGDRIGAVAGDLCDAESMLALKDLMVALGSANLDCRQDGARLDASRRDFYSFNTSIAGIEDAGAILLIGTNPRREAPVLNARIRKRWLARQHSHRSDRWRNRPDLSRAATWRCPQRVERAISRTCCARRSSRWSSSGRLRWRVPMVPRCWPQHGGLQRMSAR